MLPRARAAIWAAMVLACACLFAAPASGQEIGQDALRYLGTYAFGDSLHSWDQAVQYSAETVADHVRDGFRPEGYLLPGGHAFMPAIAASTIYDDNLFLVPNAFKVWDQRTEISPSFVYVANLPRHMFELRGAVDDVSFSQHSNLNFVNAHVRADWRIDIDAADAVGGTFQTELGHDDTFLPIDPQSPSVAPPVVTTRAALGYVHDAGRTALTTGIDWQHNTYFVIPSYGGGNIDQTVNDNDIYGGFAVINYRFSPGYRTFVAGRIDREILSNSGSGNNTSYRAEAGLSYEIDPMLQFSVSGGYQLFRFDTQTQNDSATPVVKANLRWLPTRRLTINFDASRAIARTLEGPTLGEIADKGALHLDYDVWHNIVAHADAAYENDQFVGSSRVDKVWSAGAGLDYFLNENLALTLSYQHLERASNEGQFAYSDNRTMVSLKLSR